MTITGPDATTPERLRYLLGVNARLSRFVVRARFHGWEVEPSTVAPDTIVVRPADREVGDHFVLYPTGRGRTSSLRVYDGRDGYDFAPLPTRDALHYIATSGTILRGDTPHPRGKP